MVKEELEHYLLYEVVPDIIYCKDENSKHNRSGEYGFKCDDQYLKITFEWNDSYK